MALWWVNLDVTRVNRIIEIQFQFQTRLSVSDEFNSIVVFISTDYVFDGKNAPYREADEPKPLNKYGESKLEGERVVLGANKGVFITKVRSPIEVTSDVGVLSGLCGGCVCVVCLKRGFLF